jgi:hypothetical protein
MAVNLLSYTGTPELGVGASSIPVTPNNPDLNVINNAIRDVMLTDNQRNVMMFQQKVKDRDALLEMIMKNQVSSGDILPEYRQHFDQAEKQAESAFNKWAGNLNDKEGYRNYQAAIQDLKDIAAHAQGKTMSIRALEKEKASQILPRKQADYQRWLDQEKSKPFWESVTPYQQLHDFAIDDILSGVKTFSTTARDANDPKISYDTTYVDYNDILGNKRSQYINDRDAADSIDQFFDKFQRLNPNQLVPTLDAMDAQIQRYNKDRGFNPGDVGYVPKVNRVQVSGQTLIQEPKTEFAAKYALAQQSQFATRTPKFDKDLAKYEIDKGKLALQARKLGIDAGKAGAYIRNLNAKTNKFLSEQQAVGTDIVKQYEDFVNGISPLATYERKTGNVREKLNAVFVDRLPQSYRMIGGPVMATDKNGKPTGKITVGQLEPFIETGGTKRPFYLTRYVNPTTGEQMNPDADFFNNTYNTWRSGGYRGSKEDMLKTLLKNGALEMILQGKNGAANYTSMYQSAKTINALGTSKGDENIINPPEDAPLPIDQEP